jgi:hypothetical protein
MANNNQIYKMSNAGGFKSLTRYHDMLAGNPVFIGGDYESIQTFTVGSGGQSSIDFTSIPNTYKHLQIRGIVRYSGAAGNNPMYMTFNSDSGSNYSWHGLFGDGASASAAAGSNRSRIDIDRIAGANAASNIFGTFVIDILDYANTSKFKTTRNLGGLDQNGSGFIFFESGSWRNTNAISTISFVPPSDLFVQYSSFALYGIKG